MMIHHTRVPYFLQIFLFLVTRANVSLHSVTLSASLPFISKIHAKFVSRPINPLTRAYNLHVRLSPRSSLVYPLHYFFFPHSLQRGYLAAHVSLPPLSTFSPRMNVTLDATIAQQGLYTSNTRTSYRIRIITMIRKRSAWYCVSIDHRCNVSSFQWCNVYVYIYTFHSRSKKLWC